MSRLAELVSGIKIPRMIEARQVFKRPRIEDGGEETRKALEQSGVGGRICQGDSVAITAGSRGIDNIVPVIRETVRFVKDRGGEPFIIPAMGSHGGATAKGQKEILDSLGITEEACGCPVKATMETVCIGYTEEDHLPVYVDDYAFHADKTILINRVKPHPSFNGEIESGILKMAVIGLGKQKGAALCHSLGMVHMSENIKKIGSYILSHGNVIFGIGLVENAYDETAGIHVIKAENILKEEPVLLKEAYSNFPKIAIPKYDVLLVEETGKNISGAGMDTMIISRYTHDGIEKDPHQQIICGLRLTEETHGNACGMGLLDVIPEKYKEQIDFMNTYPNLITSRIYNSAKMPMVVDNDKVAIQTSIHGCMGIDYNKPKMIWIKNTLDIGRIFISEFLLEEALKYPEIQIVGQPFEMEFRENGDLVRIDER